MWMFLGLISFVGVIIFIVMSIISLIRKTGQAKKYFKYAGASFVVFALAVSMGSSDSTKSTFQKGFENGQKVAKKEVEVPVNQPSTQPTSKPEQNSPPAETKPTYDYTVDVKGKGKFQGKWASKVGVAIVDIKETKTIKGPFDSTHASGKFMIIQLSISNEQRDAITFDSSLVKLIDTNNREYSASSEGSTALTFGNKETLFLKSVNPGITTSGYVAFDVPENLAAKDLKLVFRGGMTGDEAVLPLMRLKAK